MNRFGCFDGWEGVLMLPTLLGVGFLFTATKVPAVEISDAPPKKVKVEFQTVAVKDAGLWPYLTLLPDGDLLLIGFNQPHHGWVAGDLDSWVSKDEGQSWAEKAKVAMRPDEVSNRMNAAVGNLGEGQLIAITGGFTQNETQSGKIHTKEGVNWNMMSPAVTLSKDSGKTWEQLSAFNCGLPNPDRVVPFGGVIKASDGSLRASVYCGENPISSASVTSSYITTSRDGGKVWEDPVQIGVGLNETALLEVVPGEWLAIARTCKSDDTALNQVLKQYRSKDNGKTWMEEGVLTKALGHPANLIHLKDGRILLSYSNRKRGKIIIHLSENGGLSWGDPWEISTFWGDGGYPASAQLPNGELVTAYYAKISPALGKGNNQYHAAVVKWILP